MRLRRHHHCLLHCVITAIVFLLLTSTAANAQTPSFTPLGDLSGGAVGSAALDVSADGGVVVGEAEGSNGTEAFRWTTGGGMVGIGFLSLSDPYSTARGVSEDGSVIAGTSNGSDGVPRAYRYSGSSMTALNRYSCSDCDPVTEGRGLSGNGLVVVGSALARSGSTDPPHLDPVRWPGGGTGISDLGNLSGGEEAGEAFGASPNGSIIVGSHDSGDGKDAWYWTGSGLNELPTITGGSIIAAAALAVSDDGSTIVGYTNKSTLQLPGGTVVPSQRQAVRWTGGSYGTLGQLGDYPGATSTDSRALAVSADGAIIVGTAVNADLSNRAFIWDASNGMRDLKAVLSGEYGLDLTGWVLTSANGISDVVSGDFYLVGSGVNPQGDEEGWLAFLTPPACSDGVNNDGDGGTDYPADPECTSPTDWSEEPDCDDGLDNDGDGDVDFPADAECVSLADLTEQADCADGIDNDGDGPIDHPADPGCLTAASLLENPACSDGIDNEPDGDTDYPDDAQCVGPWDLSELDDCNDGLDNDGDGQIDYPADAQCESASDASEAAQCSDGIDNDGDGQIDYPNQHPACTSPDDPIEAPQCSDGVDNDGDGQIDWPADTSCDLPSSASENPFTLNEGDLIAVDRASRTVFHVDRSTGAQTVISAQARMQAPQGVALRGAQLVVADPAGLIEIKPSCEQRMASPPLSPNEALQVVFTSGGTAYVLEANEISQVLWSYTGEGSKSTFLSIPTPGILSELALWNGDALAIEAGGDLLTSGISVFGDGLYRVDIGTSDPTLIDPGDYGIRWNDLAVEGDDTILAVGFHLGNNVGIFRIHPGTGAVTPLNTGYSWQLPSAVAVAPDDEIYVADSGICSDGLCSGGEIVHVDPGTGTVTPLTSGGFIQGELDLLLVPEPGKLLLLLAGLPGLVVLERLRGLRRR